MKNHHKSIAGGLGQDGQTRHTKKKLVAETSKKKNHNQTLSKTRRERREHRFCGVGPEEFLRVSRGGGDKTYYQQLVASGQQIPTKITLSRTIKKILGRGLGYCIRLLPPRKASRKRSGAGPNTKNQGRIKQLTFRLHHKRRRQGKGAGDIIQEVEPLQKAKKETPQPNNPHTHTEPQTQNTMLVSNSKPHHTH